jgi:hypothetical protein
MKTIYVIGLVCFLLFSCATTENLSLLPEDELFITRKYVGNLIEYICNDPQYLGGPPVIEIKTTQDTTYGNFSIYSRKCEFIKNERLYVRRIRQGGYWIYQLENDNTSYRISEFSFENKILVQTWF